MLREYVNLVNETVDKGYERGMNLFYENLVIDTKKSEAITEAGGIENILEAMFAGADVDAEELNESDLDSIEEADLDELLAQAEAELEDMTDEADDDDEDDEE